MSSMNSPMNLHAPLQPIFSRSPFFMYLTILFVVLYFFQTRYRLPASRLAPDHHSSSKFPADPLSSSAAPRATPPPTSRGFTMEFPFTRRRAATCQSTSGLSPFASTTLSHVMRATTRASSSTLVARFVTPPLSSSLVTVSCKYDVTVSG